MGFADASALCTARLGWAALVTMAHGFMGFRMEFGSGSLQAPAVQRRASLAVCRAGPGAQAAMQRTPPAAMDVSALARVARTRPRAAAQVCERGPVAPGPASVARQQAAALSLFDGCVPCADGGDPRTAEGVLWIARLACVRMRVHRGRVRMSGTRSRRALGARSNFRKRARHGAAGSGRSNVLRVSGNPGHHHASLRSLIASLRAVGL